MKMKNVIAAAVLMFASHALACGESDSLMGLEMDCKASSGENLDISFNYHWSSCYESEKVFISDKKLSISYEIGRHFVEKGEDQYEEVWREDKLTSNYSNDRKKLSIHMSSKEETAVTSLELVRTAQFKKKNEMGTMQTLSKYRGQITIVLKNSSPIKRSIVCQERPTDRE